MQHYSALICRRVITLLPIGVFFLGLKVEGCLLSLQETIVFSTNGKRSTTSFIEGSLESHFQLSRKLFAML